MTSPPSSPTIVLYDGWCSLCCASADKLRKLDNSRNRLKMVDLRQESKLLEKHNLDPSEVRRVMHTITPDGQVHLAMDALRHAMTAVGRGWMINWTKLPIIRWITDPLYLCLAHNRLRWFGKSKCSDDACSIDQSSD
ncbi:MAG: DUF393 domain-containing protein [Phycisphaerales bacterium]|nr:DUF393 domain-containing protein [Phycisphaerales bacterium]